MKLYMCCYALGSTYFGVGTSKQKAYEDLHRKWVENGSSGALAVECCYFELSEVK